MAKLARVKPGAKDTLKALERQDGAIIYELSRRWAEISRRKAHDAAKTTEWFQRAYPVAGSLSELRKLPEES